MAQWYYSANGQQLGPVEQTALQDLYAAGHLQADSLVWCEGMAEWQPAAMVLAAVSTSAPPSHVPLPAPLAQFTPPPPYATGHYPPPPPPGFGGSELGYGGYVQQKSYHGMAVGGFVCSLVGVLCAGYIVGIVALVLGWIALNGMKKSGNLTGRGMALAAVIIGIFDIVLHVGLLVVVLMLNRH